ncbi:leucine-rich repeat flightless-interacting protein 2-like isoform X2 [Ranitomeya variabilis]|uniref:leucine-rich repeat flightless-interacting protein 2-like isoform X2 n=1 Tax=Ranitomeya variabilis TaxID=490064 RepID=UPI004055B2EC
MQCSDIKKNVLSQWTWRGKREARKQILDPDALNKLRESLDEVEDKYSNALVSITQLNNEKRSLEYQVNNLKEIIEEMEEKLFQNQTENKINLKKLKIQQTKLEECHKSIPCRDRLMRKHVIVPEDVSSCDTKKRIMAGMITTASAIQHPGDGGKGNNKNQKDKLKCKDRTTLEQNLRTAMNKMEEMEMKNNYLLKRLEKMKCVSSHSKQPNMIF